MYTVAGNEFIAETAAGDKQHVSSDLEALIEAFEGTTVGSPGTGRITAFYS